MTAKSIADVKDWASLPAWARAFAAVFFMSIVIGGFLIVAA